MKRKILSMLLAAVMMVTSFAVVTDLAEQEVHAHHPSWHGSWGPGWDPSWNHGWVSSWGPGWNHGWGAPPTTWCSSWNHWGAPSNWHHSWGPPHANWHWGHPNDWHRADVWVPVGHFWCGSQWCWDHFGGRCTAWCWDNARSW